jgi:hypothetical protein
MKKVLIFCILVLFLGSLIALESDPSDVVGFFKLNVIQGGYTAISEPFMPHDLDAGGDMDLIEVLGTQWGNLDQCLDMQSGATAVYLSGSSTWVGVLAGIPFDLSHTYWIQRNAANPTFDFYLVGEVNPSSVTYSINALGYTAFGINEAKVVALANLGFPTGALQNLDQLLDMQNGETAVYLAGTGTWVGVLASTGITPTHTYWLNTTNATGFSWTYNPTREGGISREFFPISGVKTYEKTNVRTDEKADQKSRNSIKKNLRK